MRKPSNPQTLELVMEIAKTVGGTPVFCYGGNGREDDLICPDCGAPATWQDCANCNGDGLGECICQGAGGEIICSQDCFARSCAE